MRIEDKEIEGELIALDNNEYVRCTFTACRIIFAASGPVTLDRCRFRECTWAFEGAAAFSIKFMTQMHNGSLGGEARTVVEKALANIRGEDSGLPEISFHPM